MKLEFSLLEEPYVFRVENESGASCLIDANENIGGKNKGLRPMELLAGSLAGCAAIDVLQILRKQKQNTNQFSIDIEAKRSSEMPSVFEWIHLAIQVDENVDQKKLKRNVDLVLDKYCSVAASLNKNIKIQYSINQEELKAHY